MTLTIFLAILLIAPLFATLGVQKRAEEKKLQQAEKIQEQEAAYQKKIAVEYYIKEGRAAA
ncbi:hypothetical protein QUW13_00835 [Enterococcus hirae]|jgi:hypothetical protein|nr:hypothetical protein [Enterococcaceae bacterium]MCI1918671.1 hypothetical protein [Enterococcaceae bacterium]MDM8212418.1 hypothetical protein [Enterococcus hirae]